MQKSFRHLIYFSFAILIVSFFVPSHSSFAAEEFDIYVDKDNEGSEDGSEEKPYRNISDAITKAIDNDRDKRKIYVKSGTYRGGFTLSDHIELYGAGKGKTEVTGKILIEEDAHIEDMTFKNAPTGALEISDKANVVLKKIEVKDFKRTGINALPGDGKVILEESEIHDGEGKGVYIQAGRSIEITKNKIYKNEGEGLDIREKVSGKISGNALEDNQESGLELIIGKSRLEITDNTMEKNKASGIAVQFYAEADEDGRIVILNNRLINNKKHGLDCNLPSGGEVHREYWSNSLNLQGNIFEKNGISSIEEFCAIIDAVETDEEAGDNTIEKIPTEAESLTETSINNNPREVELINELETININEEVAESRGNVLEDGLEKRGNLMYRIFGADITDILNLKEEIKKSESRVSALKTIKEEALNPESDTRIQTLINEEEMRLTEWKELIQGYESKWSLLGWLVKLWFKL